MLTISNTQVTSAHFPAYDGNGNVTALVDQSRVITARYEYSPFGELLRATGPACTVNPFRFSTKFADDESGLVYYGYRYFSPSQGRWIGRDPIGESDCNNLYSLLGNKSNGAVDPLGQFLVDVLVTTAGNTAEKTREASSGLTLVARIRHTVEELDRVQQFTAGFLEGSSIDATEILESLQVARSALAQSLKGAKEGAKAAAIVDDGHHIMPKALMRWAQLTLSGAIGQRVNDRG